MKMSKITATFTGKDGSMGFRTGQNYSHVIITNPAIAGMDFFITNDVALEADVKYRIPYQSIHSFLRNWTDIRGEKAEGDNDIINPNKTNLGGYLFCSKLPKDSTI